MILFDTDSYATRVYQLERDVSGVFTVPTLYGTGSRWYLIVRATLWPFQLSGKVARTIRRATPVSASSDARTSGEHGTSITVQLDIKV